MADVTYTPQELALIRERCAKKASDAAFDEMVYLAIQYKLDPLLKEIFCVTDNKGNDRIQVARDGFLKIANLNDQFNGLHSDTVCDGDYFALNSDGTISHQYGIGRNVIIGAYCQVFRKDRKIPAYFFAPYREYAAQSPVWRQYPSAMIIKVAESMALKRAFALSGLTSDVELDASIELPIAQEQLPAPSSPMVLLQAPAVPQVEVSPAVVMPAQPVIPVHNHPDINNFMAQANGAQPVTQSVTEPMTNKQRASAQDLLNNPQLPAERKQAAEQFFNTPGLSKQDAQAGIERLMGIIYATK